MLRMAALAAAGSEGKHLAGHRRLDRGGGERVSDRVVQLVSDPITFGQLQFTFFRQREPFGRGRPQQSWRQPSQQCCHQDTNSYRKQEAAGRHDPGPSTRHVNRRIEQTDSRRARRASSPGAKYP